MLGKGTSGISGSFDSFVNTINIIRITFTARVNQVCQKHLNSKTVTFDRGKRSSQKLYLIYREDLETGVFFVKISFDDMLEFMKFEMNISDYFLEYELCGSGLIQTKFTSISLN